MWAHVQNQVCRHTVTCICIYKDADKIHNSGVTYKHFSKGARWMVTRLKVLLRNFFTTNQSCLFSLSDSSTLTNSFISDHLISVCTFSVISSFLFPLCCAIRVYIRMETLTQYWLGILCLTAPPAYHCCCGGSP